MKPTWKHQFYLDRLGYLDRWRLLLVEVLLEPRDLWLGLYWTKEPLLGPVDLRPEWFGDWTPPGPFSYAGRWGELRLHWIVVGGESGPGARPMHPDWARRLRDDCQAAHVPFFFKQRGEWTWDYPQGMSLAHRAMRGLGDGLTVYRVGKHAAGRLLDGREWNEYPEVSRAH